MRRWFARHSTTGGTAGEMLGHAGWMRRQAAKYRAEAENMHEAASRRERMAEAFELAADACLELAAPAGRRALSDAQTGTRERDDEGRTGQ